MPFEMTAGLKEQAKAVLVFLGIAIMAVLAIVIVAALQPTLGSMDGWCNSTSNCDPWWGTVNATILAFTAAFVLFGTFASVMALIIVIKSIIQIVKGLQ